MIRSFVLNRIAAQERRLGASLEYLRHMARLSLAAFFKFSLLIPFAEHRKRVPRDAWHAARLVATRSEDCGTCVQIEINQALGAGVDAELLRTVLDERFDELPEGVAEACRFAAAVVAPGTGGEGEWRQRLEARWGPEALLELAMAVAAVRVFPTLKRALGHGTSCSLVRWKLERS